MSGTIKARKELVERLLQVNFLTDREKDILKMRLGMEGYSRSTLQKIGDKYGISRERVRQIGASIVRRIKKNMPEEAMVASNLFNKTWIPKYIIKKRETTRRKAAINKKKSIIKKRYKDLVSFIVEFSRTGEGKEKIDQLFKELRVSYRRNKSLFEPYLIEELKRWRKQYMEIKRTGIPLSSVEEERKEETPSVDEGPTDENQIS